MNKNENDLDLKNKGIAEKYIFFYQLWRELTSPQTIDSYQFKLMDTFTGIEELIDVLNKTIDGTYTSDHNIAECKDELTELVKDDKILWNYYSSLQTNLLRCLKKETTKINGKKSLLHSLNYIKNCLTKDYYNNLVNELEKSLNTPSSKYVVSKIDVTYYTNKTITYLINSGWSAKKLTNIIKLLWNSSTDNSRWLTFKNTISSQKPNIYNIFIPFNIRYEPTVFPFIIKRFNIQNNIELKKGIDFINQNNSLSTYLKHSVRYAYITIEAHDEYSATLLSNKIYANLINELSFFNLISSNELKQLSFVVANENYTKIKNLTAEELFVTNIDYYEGANRAFRLSKKITCSIENNSLRNRLLATYSYSNIGKSTFSFEEKFINYWIALESFCKTDMENNIIDNILKNVPAALCNRYVFSLLRNLFDDCLRCNITFNFSNGKTFNQTTAKDKVTSLIEIFKDENLTNELLNKCSCNSLLIFRCSQLHDLFETKNIKKLIELIKQHKNRVRLQLSRLYRIRNQIAHTAYNKAESLTRYIEHLTNYLTIFISEVLFCSEKLKTSSIEEILSYIKDNYSLFDSTSEDNLTLLFSTGEIYLI